MRVTFLRRAPARPLSCASIELLEGRRLLSGHVGLFRLRASTLPEYREGTAVIGAGDYALFAGAAGSSGSQVDLLNIKTGQWSQHQLSEGRPFAAAVRLGNLAVFAGGGLVPSYGSSDAVDIFNAASGQWSSAHLSSSRGRIAAAAAGTLALFAGGIHVTGDFPVPVATTTDVVDVYDSVTDQWSTARLSSARQYVAGASVGRLALFAGGNYTDHDGIYHPSPAVDVYDADTRSWSTMLMPKGAVFRAAATVGTKAIFAGGGIYEMYDAVTGRWSSGSIGDIVSATSVGSKALFAQDSTGFKSGSDLVDVFDAATGQWSKTRLSVTRYDVSAGSSGRFAFFAGGISPAGDIGNVLDSLEDLSPSTALSGSAIGRSAGKATVILQNTGDANLPAGYTVQVYAIPPGQYHGAVLLGSSAPLTDPLPAGSSIRLSVQIQLPANAPAPTYHLVAMAKAADGTLTPFAGGTATFRVRGPRASSSAAHTAAPAAAAPIARSPFATAPLDARAAPADPLGLHQHRDSAWTSSEESL